MFAQALLDEIEVVDSPNPRVVSANRSEVLRAFRERSSEVLFLDYPIFSQHIDGSSDILTALGADFLGSVGLIDYTALIEEASADGIGIPYQIADRRQLEAVRSNGYKVQLWTLNEEPLLQQYCGWPIDYLITDYPERASCF